MDYLYKYHPEVYNKAAKYYLRNLEKFGFERIDKEALKAFTK